MPIPSKDSAWYDAHCHLADPRYSDTSLVEVLQRSQAANVCGWVQGGVSPQDWDRQIFLQKQYGSGIITSFGLHPWWVSQCQNQELEESLTLLTERASQAQAIGELGLDLSDRFQDRNALARQRAAFTNQLEIGKKLQKPLIIHAVKSHPEIIFELQKRAPFKGGGIIHSFSATLEIAKEYLELGFLLSIGGAITRKGHKKLKAAITCIPKDKIVIETDSPDQVPWLLGLSPRELNEPANLIGIAKTLASICNMDYSDMLSSSTRNLRNLFGIAL